MHAEIYDAAAAGKRLVVEPRLARPVGVVKGEVHREHGAEFARRDQVADLPHAVGVAIGEIDAQKPVDMPGGFDHRRGLVARAAERFLAKNRHALLQSHDRLGGVERARRGDHDAVELVVEQCLERVHDGSLGGQLAGRRRHFRRWIEDRDGFDGSGFDHRLHPVEADSSNAEKADAGGG